MQRSATPYSRTDRPRSGKHQASGMYKHDRKIFQPSVWRLSCRELRATAAAQATARLTDVFTHVYTHTRARVRSHTAHSDTASTQLRRRRQMLAEMLKCTAYVRERYQLNYVLSQSVAATVSKRTPADCVYCCSQYTCVCNMCNIV